MSMFYIKKSLFLGILAEGVFLSKDCTHISSSQKMRWYVASFGHVVIRKVINRDFSHGLDMPHSDIGRRKKKQFTMFFFLQ